MIIHINSKHVDQNAHLQTLYETSVNCQMFSMNIHPNLMHTYQNRHLQTLYETLLRTYTNSNLTYSNLWEVTNLVFRGMSFHFGF